MVEYRSHAVVPGVKLLGMRDVGTAVSLNGGIAKWSRSLLLLDVGLFAGFVQGMHICGWLCVYTFVFPSIVLSVVVFYSSFTFLSSFYSLDPFV